MNAVHTVIVGGSAAGLACAKCLKDQSLTDFVILEQAEHIGQKWRNHYERLHLHTSKQWSQLPGKSYPVDQPQYPPRNAVVDYLVEYARENDLHPQFNTTAQKIERQSDGLWRVETSQGHYLANYVIMATGMNHKPKMAEFEGFDTTALSTKMVSRLRGSRCWWLVLAIRVVSRRFVCTSMVRRRRCRYARG